MNTSLREMRARRLWSQERLAREANVTVGTINQIERGRRVPNIMTAEKIARALGVQRSELFPEAAEASA